MKIANVEKKLVDKLVEQCTENIDGNQMIYNATLNSHRKVCNCCTTSIVLLAIAFLIIIGIRSAFFFIGTYNNTSTNTNIKTRAIIYYTYKWEVLNK